MFFSLMISYKNWATGVLTQLAKTSTDPKFRRTHVVLNRIFFEILLARVYLSKTFRFQDENGVFGDIGSTKDSPSFSKIIIRRVT